MKSFHNNEGEDGINMFCFYGWYSWEFLIFFQGRNDVYIWLGETLYMTFFKFFCLKGYVISKNC